MPFLTYLDEFVKIRGRHYVCIIKIHITIILITVQAVVVL